MGVVERLKTLECGSSRYMRKYTSRVRIPPLTPKGENMKLTTKSLKFWDNMFPSIEHDVNELIKLYLKENGISEHSYIFHGIKMGEGFPIRVTHNAACSCHPRVETTFLVSMEEILNPSVFTDRIRKEAHAS